MHVKNCSNNGTNLDMISELAQTCQWQMPQLTETKSLAWETLQPSFRTMTYIPDPGPASIKHKIIDKRPYK